MPSPLPTQAPARSVFCAWPDEARRFWGDRPLRLHHHLHQHKALQLDALGALIDSYPRSDYALVHTSRQGNGSTRWREGDLGGTPGSQVIEAIAQGSLWLNLRQANLHGPAYAQLLAQAYDEIATRAARFRAGALKLGILISSPGACVHYHCDLPGQLLWQIHGRKRVWIYPAAAPFLQTRWLEDIAYTGFEFNLVYDPDFDRMAMVFDLEPGQMLSWPLNAPHRVENADCLNVSVTTEHWTPVNRRAQKVHLANAVLRHRLGMNPRSGPLNGPRYWAKAALQAAWRRSPWSVAAQKAMRPVEFRLDPRAPGAIVDEVAKSA